MKPKQLGIIKNTDTNDVHIAVRYDAMGLIISGVVLGDVTQQNQGAIVVLCKGEIKLHPSVGVGISNMLNDSDSLHWETEIIKQLKADGQKIKQVKVTNTEIRIHANYQ